MLYLIAPGRQMRWAPSSALDGALLSGSARGIHEREWQFSESRADDTVILLALRNGVATRSGIVVEAWAVCRYLRAEGRIPGSAAGISSDDERDAIRREVAETLERLPLDETLVAHWVSLGGTIPQSLLPAGSTSS